MPAKPSSNQLHLPPLPADPELLRNLRAREISPRFLYQSKDQIRKWVALHRKFSPWQVDLDCSGTYRKAFAAVANLLKGGNVHLVGLGCGDGTKDADFLRAFLMSHIRPCYTAVDVAPEMTAVALRQASPVAGADRCGAAVCDLLRPKGLRKVLATAESKWFGRPPSPPFTRVCTLFGMLPVFRPEELMPSLAQAVQPGDLLVLSANLAPGTDYDNGMLHVLPQYDNRPTREWLLAFLDYMRVPASCCELSFSVARSESVRKIIATITFKTTAGVRIGRNRLQFNPGDKITVFTSYRHTPATIRNSFKHNRFSILRQWITSSGEEGVFLAQRI